MKKSAATQFLLTFLLGPLGLFYSSVPAAIGFMVAGLVLAIPTAGVGGLLVWPFSILGGFATVSRHNSLVDKEDRKHQELLAATKAAHAG
jgi:hypothetical protein